MRPPIGLLHPAHVMSFAKDAVVMMLVVGVEVGDEDVGISGPTVLGKYSEVDSSLGVGGAIANEMDGAVFESFLLGVEGASSSSAPEMETEKVGIAGEGVDWSSSWMAMVGI